MFLNLIKDHLDELRTLEGENLVIAYKGFPVEFVKNIAQDYPFLFNGYNTTDDNRLNLKLIIDNTNSLISKLLQKTSGISIVFYEELLVVQKHLDLSIFKGKIFIYENNLFDEHPNISTECFNDIELKIDNNEFDIDEGELFDTFYVNSTVINDINYIYYKPIRIEDYDNVTLIQFFKDNNLKFEIDFQEYSDEVNIDNALIFPGSSNKILEFKKDIFNNNISHDINLITDNITISEQEDDLKEIKILYYIFKKGKINLNVYIKRERLKDECRTDFMDILKKYWNSDSYRELMFYKNPDLSNEITRISQGGLIEKIVVNCEKAFRSDDFNDIFLTSPTGSGKSVLFQIPAIYLAEKYDLLTIVVSPLKALMYDQITALRDKGVNFCAYLNSDISFVEREDIIEKIQSGEISILYLSPELLLSYDIKTFIGDREIGLLVIDEAHLVTTWGRDFRVDYWYLGNYIRKIRKYSNSNFPVLALTATAVYNGPNDIVFETIDSLNMQLPDKYIGNIRRDEIEFVFNKFKYSGNHESMKKEKTKEVIEGYVYENNKTIVYCPWTTTIDQIYDLLPDNTKKKVAKFYGAINKDEKQITVEQFIKNEINVILASKAFGMGVDISDIELIYHHAPSGNLSDYIQEVGRAARLKELKGYAVTDYCNKDLKFTKILYGLSSIKQYQIKLPRNF